VRVLAESVASLPLKVYRREADGSRTEDKTHPLYGLLYSRPNPLISSATWKEVMQANLSVYGNAYSLIETDRKGNIIALWSVPASRVQTEDAKIYHINLDSGSIDVPNSLLLHIPGLSFDGIVGRSPIRDCAEVIGLGLAGQEYGARFFGGNAIPPMVLEHPGVLTPEARENLARSWEAAFGGLSNSQRVAVLEEGIKVEKISIPPEDSQFLESRKFSIEEVARIFRIPLHLIQHQEKSTSWGSGIEQLGIGFVVYTLRPWLVKWEQELNYKLFTSLGDSKHYCEFELASLLRGDSAARAGYYRELLWMGAMSPNEIRELENLPPVDGGDEHYLPLNLYPLSSNSFTPEPPAPQTESRKISRKKERIAARLRAREAHKPLLRQVWKEVMRGEERSLKKALKTKTDFKAFCEWMDSYYKGEYLAFGEKKLTPVYVSIASTTAGIVDARSAVEEEDPVVSAALDHMRSKIYSSGVKHRDKIIEAVEAEGLSPDEYLAGFEDVIEADSSTLAENESVRVGELATLKALGIMGVTRMIWMTSSANPCEFCSMLDGTVVAIENSFVGAGETLSAGDKTMDLSGAVTTPPLHDHCSCLIEAV
jgi:HK97 family phage portal protein